jgi:hypothetical protein
LAGRASSLLAPTGSRSEKIDFPAKGFKWNELGKLAQKYYADYQHITSWPTLLAMLEEINSNWYHW